MNRVIIFDFDGVIVLTEKTRFKTLQKLLQEQGYSLPRELFPHLSGKKTRAFLEEFYPELTEDQLVEIENKRRKLEFVQEHELVPGVKEVLQLFHKHKHVLAIVTGSQRKFVTSILKKNNLEKYFSCIITGEDFTSSKPNPEGFEKALSILGVKSAIIIEDSIAGVQAGKSAGCEVWGLLTTAKELPGADRVFSTCDEMMDYVKKEKKMNTSL